MTRLSGCSFPAAAAMHSLDDRAGAQIARSALNPRVTISGPPSPKVEPKMRTYPPSLRSGLSGLSPYGFFTDFTDFTDRGHDLAAIWLLASATRPKGILPVLSEEAKPLWSRGGLGGSRGGPETPLKIG